MSTTEVVTVLYPPAKMISSFNVIPVGNALAIERFRFDHSLFERLYTSTLGENARPLLPPARKNYFHGQ
ncbi:MAG: hypothetical protein IPP37_07300 [Saprospiraceae bacterium]|nr:hypothetical protein [Saprospiraceae bacterium]